MAGSEDNDMVTMADLLAQEEDFFRVLNAGEIVKGVVASKRSGEILVDVGAKSEGIVEPKDLNNLSPEELEDVPTTPETTETTEETTEALYLLGEERRIVGISGFTVRPPRARREKPRVSAFTSASGYSKRRNASSTSPIRER